MSALANLPSRAEAREDPAHRAWWPLVDAVEAARREPSARALDEVARRHSALVQSMQVEGAPR